MRSMLQSGGKVLCATLCLASLCPAVARAWWNGDFTKRKPLRIDTSAKGANITAPIGGAPVLVRLHQGNFEFDEAKPDGTDLRFVAADDKTPLPFHVERFDGLLREGLVWVGLPDIKPGAVTDLWVYYGNRKAAAAEDPKGTYDRSTVLVYHFAERGESPRDSSGHGNHAAGGAVNVGDGLIGPALRLDGSTMVTVPATPSLAWAAGATITWSAWIKPAENNATGVIFSRHDRDHLFVVGLDDGRPAVLAGRGAQLQRATATTPLPANGWHHLTVTAGAGIALYVDGLPAAKLASSLPAFDGSLVIGGEAGGAAPRRAVLKAAGALGKASGLRGELDELQISMIERPAGFIRVAAVAQGSDPGKFLTAPGKDEETGSASSGYLAIILKSVTLDGWVVIGLLAIMAAMSWIVMASKAGYLASVRKHNDRFAERFNRLSDRDLSLIGAGDEAAPKAREKESGSHSSARQGRGSKSTAAAGADAALPVSGYGRSSLWRLFEVGSREIAKRTGSGRALSGEAISAIRASLDARLTRENQMLNRNMVLLTIAISGGPFLGLLGTVVGVMITFASIAAAGDVNVNAIAPGIAAALVATIAGLGVAIPALFGYNWLLTQIKAVTATMQVFVEELVTRAAEAHRMQTVAERLAEDLVGEISDDEVRLEPAEPCDERGLHERSRAPSVA